MSGFFEELIRQAAASTEPPQERPLPKPWHGPPRNVLGGFVPERLTLARTDNAALTIESITGYQTGFEFALVIRGDPSEEDETGERWDPFAARYRGGRFGRHGSEEIDRRILLFGVQFADGSKASNLGHLPWREDESPIPPVLFEQGGGGGGAEWRQNYWVWPLPPSGPVGFVCEWQARGIQLSRVEIDAQEILAAATHAETLWPEPEGSN